MAATHEWKRRWSACHREAWNTDHRIYVPLPTAPESRRPSGYWQSAAICWFWSVGVPLGFAPALRQPMVMARPDVAARIQTFFRRWAAELESGDIELAIKSELEIMNL